jgi:hypothetical protein
MSEHQPTDEIMRGISYEPVPGFPSHHRWWRIELAYGRPICSPSLCVQGFTFWLGERALYG